MWTSKIEKLLTSKGFHAQYGIGRPSGPVGHGASRPGIPYNDCLLWFVLWYIIKDIWK